MIVSSVKDMGAKQLTVVPFENVCEVRNRICVASEFSENSYVKLLGDSVRMVQSTEASNPMVVNS